MQRGRAQARYRFARGRTETRRDASSARLPLSRTSDERVSESRRRVQMSHDVFATTGECLTDCGTDLGPSAEFRCARVRAGLALSRLTARAFVSIPVR